MSKNTIVIGILALALGIAVGYGYAGNKADVAMNHNMDSTMDGMTVGLENKSGAEFEQAFIDDMIVHHEGAVAMAQMVLQKSQRPELMQLANDIISAQAREITMMREWNVKWFGAAYSGQ